MGACAKTVLVVCLTMSKLQNLLDITGYISGSVKKLNNYLQICSWLLLTEGPIKLKCKKKLFHILFSITLKIDLVDLYQSDKRNSAIHST